MKKNFNQLLHCVPRYFRKIFTIYRGNIAVAFPLRNTLQQLNFKSIRNYQLWLALKNDDQQAANDNTDCGIFIGGPLNIIITDRCHEAATCRYCFYSVAKNQHFAP